MDLQHFERVRSDVDVQPFLDEIDSQEGAWDASTGRQDKIQVQREAQAIPIRGLRKSAIGDRKRRDVHESRWTTGSKAYPHVRAFLESFAEERGARLGRAKLVRLPPGHRVYPHVDRGEYYVPRDRYHLVLHSVDGSMLKAADETVRMRSGELWRFDNKQMHEASNEGDQARIHLIFDMLPAGSDVPH